MRNADYKKNENKEVLTGEFYGVEDAKKLVSASMARYNTEMDTNPKYKHIVRSRSSVGGGRQH